MADEPLTALLAWRVRVEEDLGRPLTEEEEKFRDICGERNASSSSTAAAIQSKTTQWTMRLWKEEEYRRHLEEARDKRLAARRKKFMPDDIPKYVRCYDNGGEKEEGGSRDNFTVVFSGRYRDQKTGGMFVYIGMNGVPFHPQMGIGMHGESRVQIDAREGWAPAMGRKCHLGRRIHFEDLPRDCRRLVMHDYLYLWDLVPEAHDTEIDMGVVDRFVKETDGNDEDAE